MNAGPWTHTRAHTNYTHAVLKTPQLTATPLVCGEGDLKLTGPIRLDHAAEVWQCIDTDGGGGGTVRGVQHQKTWYSQHYWECFTVTAESLSQAIIVTVKRHSCWRIKERDTTHTSTAA